MAEKLGGKYAAIRPIVVNGVFAYQPGDLVHVDAVEGPDAWLKLGIDVEARAGVSLDMPAKSASQAAWAAYAASQGMDDGEAQGMTRTQLIEACGPADGDAG